MVLPTGSNSLLLQQPHIFQPVNNNDGLKEALRATFLQNKPVNSPSTTDLFIPQETASLNLPTPLPTMVPPIIPEVKHPTINQPTNTNQPGNREALPQTLAVATSGKTTMFPLWGKLALGTLGLTGLGLLVFHHFSDNKLLKNFGKNATIKAEKNHPPSTQGVKTPPTTGSTTIHHPAPSANPNLTITSNTPLSVTPVNKGYTPALVPQAKFLTELKKSTENKELQQTSKAIAQLELLASEGTSLNEAEILRLQAKVTALANQLAREQLAIVLQQRMNLSTFIDDAWHENHELLTPNFRLDTKADYLKTDLKHLKAWIDTTLMAVEEQETPKKTLETFADSVEYRSVFNAVQEHPSVLLSNEKNHTGDYQPFYTYNACAIAEMAFLKQAVLLLGANQTCNNTAAVQASLNDLKKQMAQNSLFKDFDVIYEWSQQNRKLRSKAIDLAKNFLEMGFTTKQEKWNQNKYNLAWKKEGDVDDTQSLKVHFASLFSPTSQETGLVAKIKVLKEQAEAVAFIIEKRIVCEKMQEKLDGLLD